MEGLHLIADLCRRATVGAGLTIVGEHWHKFPSLQGAAASVTTLMNQPA